MFLLLGGVITLVGLLIFWGKQYYLVAGISPHSGGYSAIEKQKGRVLGGVTIGLGLLALLVGLVTHWNVFSVKFFVGRNRQKG